MFVELLVVLEESAVPIDAASVLEPKLDCLMGDECSTALGGTCAGLGVFPVRLFSGGFPLPVAVDPVHTLPAGTLTGPMLPKLRFVARIG